MMISLRFDEEETLEKAGEYRYSSDRQRSNKKHKEGKERM